MSRKEIRNIKSIIREPKFITQDTPMLFLLHGYGSNEKDLYSFVPDLPNDWLVISCKAPYNTSYGGSAWYDIDFNNSEKFINKDQANQSLDMILEEINAIKEKYGTANSPVHLCGFSQGGVLSYSLALSFPQLFQKVVCLSTYPEHKILQRIEKNKKAFIHLRFFISHGTEDTIIPLDWAKKGPELLYDLGIYFTFREYTGGHGISQKNYTDLMEFFSS